MVVVTATPAAGYSFSHWEGACTGSAGCTVIITGDATVTAVFTENQYILTVNQTGLGTITKSPDQETYTYGQVVNLTATAEPGWSFAGWTGDCSGNGDCQVTMDDNKSVTATFTQDTYNLDITIVGNGTVTPDSNRPVSLRHISAANGDAGSRLGCV